MKTYRIRDWAALFENNRSRTVKDLAWVPIPNRHDGENYSLIICHEDGAIIYAAWILILQVASRCQPRGTLLRDNKKPHTPASLSIKTRAPEIWFTKALNFLENQTDWLEIVEDCQDGGSQVRHDCQSPDEERREGIEGKEPRSLNSGQFAESPSWEEFWAYCTSPHCGIGAEWFARDKFLAAQQDRWRGKSDWRSYARRVRGWWDNDGRPMQPPKRGIQPAPKNQILTDATYDSTRE